MQTFSLRSFAAFWRDSAAQLRKTRSIVAAGVLAALGVALRALIIPLGQTLRIGFSFLAPAVSGYLFGPLAAGFAGMVVDVLGYLLNPGGAYHFGFTLNAFINGLIFGCWLYKRPVKLWLCLGACLSSMLVVNLLLNPLWLAQLYGNAYVVLVGERLIKNLITLPINTGLLFALLKVTEKQKNRIVSH